MYKTKANACCFTKEALIAPMISSLLSNKPGTSQVHSCAILVIKAHPQAHLACMDPCNTNDIYLSWDNN